MNGKKLTSDNPLYKHDPAIHNFSAARRVLPFVFNISKINSVLDVGCGTGTWLAVAHDLGVEEIRGVDGVNLREDELKIPYSNFINADLTKAFNLQNKFDLVISLEVAEHLPASAAKTFVDTLTAHGDLILFSAAIPGQDGQNHLNEQWPGYWASLFGAKGYLPCNVVRDFFWDDEQVDWWYRQNITLYAPENVLLGLNLPASKSVAAVVHPALLKEKLDKINELTAFIDREVWHPTFANSFKRMIKAIFK